MLADPGRRSEPGDALKYIPLSPDDPHRYVSLGVTLRERFESNDAVLFGVGTVNDEYLLHRLELHADAHITDRARLFVQLENALAPGREHRSVVDANHADLRLAFVDIGDSLGNGAWKVRLGRQEVAFDLQRFASVRDGANVRQAFDALWAQYEQEHWLASVFLSQPVQYSNDEAFDDRGSGHFTFRGTRVRGHFRDAGQVSATFSEFSLDSAHFLSASGDERRRSLDVHYGDRANGFDWDVEGIAQRGSVGSHAIRAWAIGSIAGYTFGTAWQPRVSLQFDAASGDEDPSDRRIGTFNPLFPNGYYVTQSGYTGYSNLIHFKQTVTFAPAPAVRVLGGVGELWRQTTHDAVYAQPIAPVARTAGQGDRYTATYLQLRAEWTPHRNLAFAFEANHYFVSSAIRNVGGGDAQYVALEVRWGW